MTERVRLAPIVGLALALLLAAGPLPAAATGDGFDRLGALVHKHAPEGTVPDLEALRRACAGDLRCGAEKVVGAWPEGARLQAVPRPDTDLIRLARTPPSITAVERVAPGVLRVRLDRFGRRAGAEAAAALGEARPGDVLELDLRGHGGGSIGRMLKVAALFIGPRAQAFRIVGRRSVIVFAVPAPTRETGTDFARIDVLIGAGTASSAEVLAALLHRYAGARLVGERTHGKNWAEQPLRVGHGWHLMVRAGEIRVDGEVLEGGLVPDVAAGS